MNIHNGRAVIHALRIENETMQTITPRQREVLRLFAGPIPPTSGDIARILGITRSRAHQHVVGLIAKGALRRALPRNTRAIVLTAFGVRVLRSTPPRAEGGGRWVRC